MFDKMISHFAGERVFGSRHKQPQRPLDGSYVRMLRRTYTEVYGR